MTLAKKGFMNILPAIRYYKKQIIFAVLFVAILLGMVAFCAPDHTTVTDMNSMTETMLGKVDELVNPTSVDEVKELTKVTFENGTLTVGSNTMSDTSLITSINELCQGIAVIFVCMTFFISLFCSKDRDLQEEILKKCVFFIATLALVWYAQDICYGIAGIGSAITEKLANNVAANGGIVDATTQWNVKQVFFESVYTDDTGWTAQLGETFASLGLWLQLLIPGLAMWVVKMIINVTCWSRAFEIVTLSTFAPLAFADASSMDHFGHGGGSRFIKNMCALSISGAIILFIMMFGSAMSVQTISAAVSMGSISEIISGFTDVLIISFAEVGLVLKAQSISKTLLGVG